MKIKIAISRALTILCALGFLCAGFDLVLAKEEKKKVQNAGPASTRTQFNPHPDLDIGVDVLWATKNNTGSGEPGSTKKKK